MQTEYAKDGAERPKAYRILTAAVFLTAALLLNGCGQEQTIEVTGISEFSGEAETGAQAELSAEADASAGDTSAAFDHGSSGAEESAGEMTSGKADAVSGNGEMTSGNSSDPGADAQKIAVYVRGAVNKPGVYYLDFGSRIVQAITAAGGFTADADTEWLNQAELLTDGQMITVNTLEETSEMEAKGQVPGQTAGSAPDISAQAGAVQSSSAGAGTVQGAGQNGGSLVNLNTASKEELMTLPGIGEAKAESIIRYREENGPFASPEDVMNISGIKNSVFSKIRDSICV